MRIGEVCESQRLACGTESFLRAIASRVATDLALARSMAGLLCSAMFSSIFNIQGSILNTGVDLPVLFVQTYRTACICIGVDIL